MTSNGPGDPRASYGAGQAVDVYWGSSWWPGTIKKVNQRDSYRIGYDGWQSSWDEDVNATRLRPRNTGGGTTRAAEPGDAARGDPNARYAAGEAVEIHWGQSWWPGRVVSVAGERYAITYDGWSSSHDETVDATRLRRRSPPSSSPTAASPK